CLILILVWGWLVWEWLASLEHVLTALIDVEGKDEHQGSNVGLHQSKMSFHQVLDLILELDGGGFFGVSVKKLATGRLVNGSSCDEIDMVIKDLYLEPKDIVAKFYGSSRWKELCKETSSKILPCGDGSY
nr:hypothetical protein [Tanacetum cinerariifolium]